MIRSKPVRQLNLISYLAPSIPAEFFALVARHIEAETGVATSVTFEPRISGPLAGDDDPFADGRADVGFVCAPSVRFLGDAVTVLPSPVPSDPRANGRAVYFADVVVRAGSPVRDFDDLRGATWAYNDPNSKSGWFSMLERAGGPDFFARCIQSGSHLRSLELVADGEADAAAIDSNVLRLNPRGDLRVIESWGPFAIQPVIVRTALDDATKRGIAAALLSMHERHGESLAAFGFARFAETEPLAYR
jgi:ABC-type phosphate/phosphonate transport system substrate-binding protein